MKKNIWMMNHYATNQYFNEGGRHYWMAEHLLEDGRKPIIFCANLRHNHEDEVMINAGEIFTRKEKNDIPFVFIKTTPYTGNGFSRIKNMVTFYLNLLKVAPKIAEQTGKPDVIYASSVHPLTLVAGLKLAKRLNVPCICEVRDLWPESIVAYGMLRKNHPVAKILYALEKWIYRRADKIIMTWPGGKKYIEEKGWEKDVPLEKVVHISNGVDLPAFYENANAHPYEDEQYCTSSRKKVVYAGSIRRVNRIDMLLDSAKLLQGRKADVQFFIFGAGNELAALKERCKTEKIENVTFAGFVPKKYIPSILMQSDVNILHNESTVLNRFGQSQNKLFEYLAAGKCIVQTYPTAFNVIDDNNCGIVCAEQSAEEIASAIEKVLTMDDYDECGVNAKESAKEFDFTRLTARLADEIDSL